MTAATARASMPASAFRALIPALLLAALVCGCASAAPTGRPGAGGSGGVAPTSATCPALASPPSVPDCAAAGSVLAARFSRTANPHFDEQYGQFVGCLRVRGVMVHADPGNSGVSFDPGFTPPPGTGPSARECANQVFLTSP
ncbi:MAG: hypothetical protein QOI35_1368 [Cryptosporangiaceae bacterium]|jgi:hypothetical protein|nr:hypothetical protein [Cryptosporangiaceae bacterium]MDQ1655946.1 hypothetical protein [Cryptosporangiaceae bacterium]